MYCNKCGSEIRDGLGFCPKCGNALRRDQWTDEKNVPQNEMVEEDPPEASAPGKKSLLVLTIVMALIILALAAFSIFFIASQRSGGGSGSASSLSGISETDDSQNARESFSDKASDGDSAAEESVHTDISSEASEENAVEEDAASKTHLSNDDIAHIESIIASDSHNAKASVCIIELNTEKITKTKGADKAMSASAMINIPILYTAFRDSDKSGESWESTEIVFNHSTGGRGYLKESDSGEEYSLDYLLSILMAYGDNNISNTLMDYFGMQYIDDTCHEEGYGSVDFQRHIGQQVEGKDNYISASDAASIIAELYKRDDGRDYLNDYFMISDSAQYDGLGRYLPGDVGFLNHNAMTGTTYNEVCIVDNGVNPYVIAFMSNDGDFESSEEIAAEISEYVFDVVNVE